MTTARETAPDARDSREPPEPQGALKPCAYIGTGGAPCRFTALRQNTFCFWHSAEAPKTGPLAGPLLVRLANEDVNMEGFQLAGIDLECRHLVGAQLIQANLEGARLFRAHVEGAHLFGANLRGASLFKANLQAANLRSADLTGANLLGANVKGAKLEGIVLGKNNIVANELEGNALARRRERGKALKAWQEAGEIYLALLNNHREAGRSEEAGELFYRLMVAKRKLMSRTRVNRWVSWFMDVLCGYGERPRRVVFAWVLLIFVSSLFYFGLGILDTSPDVEAYSALTALKTPPVAQAVKPAPIGMQAKSDEPGAVTSAGVSAPGESLLPKALPLPQKKPDFAYVGFD
ncbi:MAG TPA: pentapeptide repeat-containing protein, partial [Candidatus Hydrogenedentes bacterium]|nr:pentapeptide repeat-containing protein [Candidatus Hydrogenedentota bacterium]